MYRTNNTPVSSRKTSYVTCFLQNYNKGLKTLFLIAGLLVAGYTSYCQNQIAHYTTMLDGAAGQLKVDSSRIVADTVFFNPTLKPTIVKTNSLLNVITFRINEFSNVVLPDSFKADLNVRVYYTDVNNLTDSVTSKTLSINYYKNKTYNNKAIYYFFGGYQVKVKVLSLTVSYATTNAVTPLLQLENEMTIDRQYTMDCSNNAITTISKDTSTISTQGELKVLWTPTTPAEEYDLEWAYVDQNAVAAGRYNDPVTNQLSPALVFANNASRVSISTNSYNIPMLYEADGTLYFRVRAVQTLTNGGRKVTAWSSDYVGSGGLGSHNFVGHERKLNWQVSTSFAEGGKRKSVVQYFDGSLRNRQTVTKDNTSNSTVVAETFYDQQGRPAIQVLPAPTLSSLIKYTPRFNASLNGVEYDKSLYDTLITGNEYCAGNAPAFDTVSGAARYYSWAGAYGTDSFKTKGINRYIPDSRGFPFTETRYTQDNTGRITAQSGVDTFYRIGSGHETKYYYGSPDQYELDALFGTEVGDASHYQKNMVRDANGQYSVSYVDMHGRTIATALAGQLPVNSSLQQLASYTSTSQKIPLLTKSNNIIKGTTVESTKGLLVTKAGMHNFKYSIDPQSLQLPDSVGQPLCFDCLYNLTITITDDCGNQKLPLQQPYVSKIQNFTLGSYDTVCGQLQSIDTFSLWLEEGSYFVTKQLSISDEAMNWYRDSFYLKHLSQKMESVIYQQQMQAIKGQLGNCNQSASGNHEYQSYRNQMLLDLTPPFGQYALSPNVLGISVSIFNKDAGGVFNYQKPYSVYLDENGNFDSAYNNLGEWKSIDQLDSASFVDQFKPSWANSLLPYHPEYCLMQQYEIYSGSHIYDEDFSSTDTYAAAKAKGYLNPAGDPAYIPRYGDGHDSLYYYRSSAIAYIDTALRKYQTISGVTYSLWTTATIQAHCGDNPQAACVSYYNSTNHFKEDSLTQGELDYGWRFFRDQYLRIKRNYLDSILRMVCGYPTIPANAYPNFLNPSTAATAYPPTNPNANYQQAGRDTAAAFYSIVSNSYVQRWWQQLGPCSYTSADSAIIIPRLLMVSKEGTDSTHPFGASTVRPASTYRFRSFDDVIKQYNDSAYPGQKDRAYCNGYIIDAPKPYNQPVVLTNQIVYGKPDSCTCAALSKINLHGIYSASTLQSKFGTTISQADVDTLVGLCNGTIKTKFLVKPIKLPPALQCGVTDVCVACDRVKNLYDTFKVKFPVVVLDYNDEDTLQLARNTLFANWMNAQLGYSKSAMEYMIFMDSCGLSRDPGVAGLLPDSLTKIKSDFVNYYYYNDIHRDSSGVDTTTWKVDFGGNTNNTGVPHNLIFKNGFAKFPNWVPGTQRVDFDKFYNRDTMCNLNNKFAFEIRLKKSYDTTTLNKRPYVQLNLYGDNGAHLFVMQNAVDYWNTYGQWQYGADHPDTGYYSIAGFARTFADWTVMRIVVDSNKFKFYYDGVYSHSLTYLRSFNKLYGYTLSVYPGHSVTTDWVRVYDATDKLVYNEEFDGGKEFAQLNGDPTHLCSKPDCATSFKDYFNTQRGTNWSFAQIDSFYLSNTGSHPDVCVDTTNITTDQLNQYLTDFRNQQVNPTSGYADLDMRTFAGNKTPDEGPKGVFDVNGNLIGNTVDGSVSAIKSSFVSIWNSSVVNQQLGTISLLANGKFRLVLQPGRQVPKGGLVGMRFYKYDNYDSTTGDQRYGVATYIDFGDSVRVKSDVANSNSSTTISFTNDFSTLHYSANKYYVKELTPISIYTISHKYSAKTLHTVTVYHSDVKGVISISDYLHYENDPLRMRNFRGYMPEETQYFNCNPSLDSTYQSTKKIVNFNKIKSIEFFVLYGDSMLLRNQNIDTLFHNSKLNSVTWRFSYLYNYSAGGINETPPSMILPQMNVYFKSIRYMQLAGISEANFDQVNFALPKLRMLSFGNGHLTTTQIDRMLNQIASVNEESGGVILGTNTNVPGRTSASDSAVAKLTSRGWQIYVTNDWTGFVDPPYIDVIDSSQLPVSDEFADFIAAKTHSTLTYERSRNLYLAKSGFVPDPYTIPDTSSLKLCGKAEVSSPEFIDSIWQASVCNDSTVLSIGSAAEIYKSYQDSVVNAFNEAYLKKCLAAASYEKFTDSTTVSEYHYTLYYYDQAGNLVKTIPPAGVVAIRDTGWYSLVAARRAAGTDTMPSHQMATIYRYNSLNQVISQVTPDAGVSAFWYDRLGRLALSQNAQQKIDSNYSYTVYDSLGRITEVGQKKQPNSPSASITRSPSQFLKWLQFRNYSTTYNPIQVTQTIYDSVSGYKYWFYENLYQARLKQYSPNAWQVRNRVAYTKFFPSLPYNYSVSGTDTTYTSRDDMFMTESDYAYDMHGNVQTQFNLVFSVGTNYSVLSYHGENAVKVINYKYDLISGKVNQVRYNPDFNDEFYHRYEYDAENRLTDVYTTETKAFVGIPGLEEHEAHYEYYKHGPLARVVLGQNQVQGMDYAYSLQGWLKGVNSTSLKETIDMGEDGNAGGINKSVAKDAFGFNLNYFTGDYRPISPSVSPFPAHSAYLPGSEYRPLYNGNISSMAVNIGKFAQPQLCNYQYDQLNRLVAMDVYRNLNESTNSWSGLTASTDYKERIAYDANGNIQKYLRQGIGAGSAANMDSLTYSYNAGTNQLNYIRDRISNATTHGSNYSVDIDDQAANNYTYDAIGNLKGDVTQGNSTIKWNVYGKIMEIQKNSTGSAPAYNIKYLYDPAGNRVGKNISKTGAPNQFDWYIRDPQGNVMAVYEVLKTAGGPADIPCKLIEHQIYGSSRLGTIKRDQDVDSFKVKSVNANLIGATYLLNFSRGNKFFELDNHLGNVLVTVSDRKFGTDVGSDGLYDYYFADVVNASDYYSGGMLQPNRTYTASSNYRYGFNGKENDNEVKGTGNEQDYGMRIYDPRVMRFLSVDPLTKKYPELTPYQFASNRPIDGIDLDGREYTPAGRYGPNQLAVDATSVTTTPLNPALIQLQKEETTKRQLQKALAQANQQVPPIVSQKYEPAGLYERQQHEAYKERKLQEAGYNADGSKPAWMKLADDKTWNRFADNIAFPTLELLSLTDGIGALRTGISNLAKTATQLSVDRKLARYLLNPDHAEGASKAKWFKEALGFSKENSADLAKQIVFDEEKATVIGTNQYGIKYNQTIPIVGANGKKIDVVFAWLKDNEGNVNLVTAIPTKK